MIIVIKERDKLLDILKLEAMNRRTPTYHSEKEKIQDDLKIKRSEISGEKEIDYRLGFLDEKRYLELHNVRLKDENGFFQMDTLLMSEHFTIVIEAKNWKGSVLFSEHDQVIRQSSSGLEEGYQNPISQVKTQVHRLQQWLQRHSLTNIPIEYLVVFSNPKTIIQRSSPTVKIPYEVIHNQQLLFRIKELEKKYKRKSISREQLFTIATSLKENHQPFIKNMLEYYNLQMKELIKGVFCPECGITPMERKKKKWYCLSCGCYSDTAHYAALDDYFLIAADKINNREARNFLMVESRYVIKRLMLNGGYYLTGTTKASVYKLELKTYQRPIKEGNRQKIVASPIKMEERPKISRIAHKNGGPPKNRLHRP